MRKPVLMPVFIAIIGLVLLSTSIAEAGSAKVKGIYSLTGMMKAVKSSVFDLHYVEGLSIRAGWKDIEPVEGIYEWDYLDNIIQEAANHDKKVMIRILSGVHTPLWVYDKGVPTVTFSDSYGHKHVTPVPWDDIYLTEWINFIYALGDRYNSNDTVVLVHMSGSTIKSAEMHLLKGVEGRQLMYDAGYSKSVIVNAWERVLDAYDDALDKKALSLNLAIPLVKDGALEEIIYEGESAIRKNFRIQGNYLKASTDTNYLPHQLITDFDEIKAGFQMVSTSRSPRLGSLEGAIDMGLEAGARYFEIYETDIRDETYSKLLEETNKELKD